MVRNTRYYFIQEHTPENILHGSIGNVDVERVFESCNIQPIRFPYRYSFSLRAKLVRVFYLLRLFLHEIPRGAVVFYQHPPYAGMSKWLLKLLRYRKSITIVCFITDISGLRFGNDLLLQREIRLFRTYRNFIVHNEAMYRWLHEHVSHGQVAKINFFDFLTSPLKRQRSKSETIVFAGNLEKSPFVQKLGLVVNQSPSLLFNIYGPHVTPAMQNIPNVSYKGTREPYYLPGALEGSFGLVWDGEGVGELAGAMGLYLRYNSPHKISLYIVANMPVIVHEDAAVAALVQEYHIGFTVKSLFEIEEKIKTLTEDEYQQMCENTHALASQISTGGCLTAALNSLKEYLVQDS